MLDSIGQAPSTTHEKISEKLKTEYKCFIEYNQNSVQKALW